ncbi:EamA family transporter RarD [Nakamurella sp. A5-74]|uniref:EamA family transporter RarD n=1 Tax=Nakamurella sp. A5-74 TaxID=3158264 RepID=A0AAU8DRC0_9ACTN
MSAAPRERTPAEAEARIGLLAGLAAYASWGFFPLYFRLVRSAGAFEILAHRVLWSCLTVALMVTVVRKWPGVRTLFTTARSLRTLALAAVLVSINWVVYIWAVNNDHVLEASLGYFINPLVTVLLGVVVLKERLRPLQWAAVGTAAVAVLVIAVGAGTPPWIALALAFSFGSYGLVKKHANAGALESLAVETTVLTPLALGFLVVLTVSGQSTFTSQGTGHLLLLISTGLATSLPLIAFGAAATRLPLTVLGLLQYLTPITQFVIGAVVLHEQLSTARWVGFVLVWVALIGFTLDQLVHRRRGRGGRGTPAGPAGLHR